MIRWILLSLVLPIATGLLPLGSCLGKKVATRDGKSEEVGSEGLIQLDDTNFVGYLTELAGKYDHVLLEFYSHWCPACRSFQPAYKQIAKHILDIDEKETKTWKGKDGRPVRLAVARLDCPENTNLCDAFGINRYPTLYVDTPLHFSTKSKDSLMVVEAKPRSFKGVLNALEKVLKRDFSQAILPEGTDEDSGTGGEIQDDEKDGGDEKDSRDQVLEQNSKEMLSKGGNHSANLDDIIAGTVLSFQYLRSKALLQGKDKRGYLIKWLELLTAAHPVKDCRAGAHDAMQAVLSLWPESSDSIKDLDSLKKVNICGEMDALPAWVGCAGSTVDTRGYTCGLWQVMHALSVRMPTKGMSDPGSEWLETIKDFISNYFQCGDCASHFVSYVEDARDVKSKKDAVLWLWKTHNKVNKRLAEEQDGTENADPKFPHVQWPTREICEDCRLEGDDSWDDDRIYDFLFEFYAGEQEIPVEQKATEHSKKATSTWRTAYGLVALVFAIVYMSLRNSNHYAVKAAGTQRQPSFRAFRV
eukprot:jgi/Picsp_1/4251/NSC_01760-R1_quiescin-sulfhydryl oxidase 1